MSESALRDGLTRAYNKRYFSERIESELQYSLRHDTPLSLIFLDIDHFKAINDHHGHQAGDHVLVQLSTLAMSMLGEDDIFARYGGEEFAIIARGVDAGRGAGPVRAHARQRRGASVRLRRRRDPGHHQRGRLVRARCSRSRRRSISSRAPTRRSTRRSAAGATASASPQAPPPSGPVKQT